MAIGAVDSVSNPQVTQRSSEAADTARQRQRDETARADAKASDEAAERRRSEARGRRLDVKT